MEMCKIQKKKFSHAKTPLYICVFQLLDEQQEELLKAFSSADKVGILTN